MRQPMPNSRQAGSEPELSRNATVSSEYLRLFAFAAETRGLDVGPILAASGIDRAILGRRGARVGARAAAEVWKRTTRRLSDPLFGLTAADAIPIGALSLMDYLVMSSADVGDALGRVARYAPLMSDAERLTLTARGHEARFRCDSKNEVPHITEMIMGIFLQRARQLFGPSWSVKAISFAHSPLGPRATYDRICQAPVHFEMPFTEAVFARDLLAMPMAGADPRMSAIFTREADAALATLAPPAAAPSFIDSVKRVLDDGLEARDLTLTRLADHLGISARTLQRRLRAAGITHRGLVRGVREDLANRSLATRVSQGQIARTLGYSGPGAFQRAFKRWSGMTPGQHRRTR
jgi:AraC-like DNA-binding protein